MASSNGRASQPIDVLALLDLAPALGRDLEDHIIHWGHGAQSLYGFSAEEALGKISYELLKTLFPRPIEELRACLLSTGHWKGELAHTRKDGSPITVISEWALQTGPECPCAILEFDQDITEHKEAEREQATLAAIVANSPDAIVGENLEGVIETWNSGAEHIFGYTAAEVIGRHISILAPPGDPSDVMDIVRRAGHGETVRRVAVERVRKDGQRIMVSLAVCPIRTKDGRIIGIAKMAHDITDLRQAREALQRHNQRLRLLNAAAERLLLADDPSHALSSVYEQMAEHLQIDGFIEFQVGPSEHELELVCCRAFVEVQQHSKVSHVTIGQGVAGKVAQTRQPIVLANVHQSSDPELQALRNLDIHAYACEPLLVGDRLLGTLSFASRRRDQFDAVDQQFFQTVANYMALAKERLRLMRELQQHANSLEGVVRERTAQLLEANTNLQTFAYTAAHDLRSPLRSIRSFAEIVFRESDQLSATNQLCLRKVIESTEEISLLLDDLLEYSKLSRADLPQHRLDLDQVVEQALGLLQEEIRTKGAEISIGQPLPAVIGNLASAVLVVANLVSNALKFTPRQVQPKVRIWAERSNTFVRLGVEDNGIGIAETEIAKLFEPFQRLNPRSAYPGTGLGLAIVRRAVERMGGRVGIESKPGKGSRFWVELKAAPSQK